VRHLSVPIPTSVAKKARCEKEKKKEKKNGESR
jgi:hypothetical protein